MVPSSMVQIVNLISDQAIDQRHMAQRKSIWDFKAHAFMEIRRGKAQ